MDAKLKATARVKLTKLDEKGAVIGVEEREVDLTEEEVKALWDLQEQA